MDNGERDAAQATRALLQLAKSIAESVLGQASEETVREVFGRLCCEVDARGDVEPTRELAATRH